IVDHVELSGNPSAVVHADHSRTPGSRSNPVPDPAIHNGPSRSSSAHSTSLLVIPCLSVNTCQRPSCFQYSPAEVGTSKRPCWSINGLPSSSLELADTPV